jgi:hypothetical protein
MGRNKKPRKAYRPYAKSSRAAVRLQPWKLDAAFGPIELILNRVERDGLLDITAAGTLSNSVVTRGERGLSLVVKGLAETFDIARGRDAECPDSEPLHRFADRLDGNSQISPHDIADCRRCVAALRKYAGSLPTSEMTDIVKTASIKFALEDGEDD